MTTGLSSVVDLERLGAVATRIAAAAPERTIPTGSLHRVGAAHRTCDDAGLSLFGFWGGGIHSGWPPASTGLFSQQLLEAAALSEAASRGDLGVAPDGFRWRGDGHPYSFETQTGPRWLAGGNGASGGLFCCGGTDMTSKSRAGSIFRRCRTRFFSASPGSVETGHSPRTDRNCRCVSACKRRSADRAERLG